jgi:hypothetical protein
VLDLRWWRFRQLLDVTKGGELAWAFAERQPEVRGAFDRLEKRRADELPDVERQAVDQRATDAVAASKSLARFTERCAQQALQTLEELLAEFGHDPTTGIDPRWAPPSTPPP